LVCSSLGVAVATAGGPIARAAYSTGCSDPYPAQRDPANPLMLRTPPGSNPLSGASFFVDGPTHGAAAGEIARVLGIDSNVPTGQFLPAFPDSLSWIAFKLRVELMLITHPAVATEVRLLEKIADEPETQRISSYSEHGTPAGLLDFARKLFCHNFTADPDAIPVINTYFLHPALHGCPTAPQIRAYMPLFERRVNTVVDGTGNRPAVFLLELDGIGSSACIQRHGGMPEWEAALRYEVDRFATLPHAVVYVEAGYSDGNSPKYTAGILNKIDIRRIRGFFTNDTHNAWTIDEIKWGEKISAMTHGAHFIVNTSSNGQGPLRNRHRALNGNENLCNPPGRGLGPRPTTSTGFPNVDAFLWVHPPGNSSGCGGGPPSGIFYPSYAEGLAARANGRLGPGYPSQPY
jgi:endoglucanase